VREIFDWFDVNGDGIIELEEYKKALKNDPDLFHWFELLNTGINDGKKVIKETEKIKL
jgi:Ca2+-binding EF-hand superfamily protein